MWNSLQTTSRINDEKQSGHVTLSRRRSTANPIKKVEEFGDGRLERTHPWTADHGHCADAGNEAGRSGSKRTGVGRSGHGQERPVSCRAGPDGREPFRPVRLTVLIPSQKGRINSRHNAALDVIGRRSSDHQKYRCPAPAAGPALMGRPSQTNELA